ncbi:MAG: phosphoribosylglycinamide formyltransferase [Pseudomonadota bacterium]
MSHKRIVVLISGRGSNLQALLAADLPAKFAAVVSNVPDAGGLAIARAHGIPTIVIDHRKFTDRATFDAALAAEIDRHAPDLLVLAGFMRVLTDSFVRGYAGKMLNIHPSLLPAFTGLHTHRRALAEGVRVHGCTVHFVTAQLDHGPIVIQAAVAVHPHDTEDTLAARVLEQEHRIYRQAVRWYCEDRIRLTADGKIEIKSAATSDETLVCPQVDSSP